MHKALQDLSNGVAQASVGQLRPHHLFGLEGKVAIVTGASGWLGLPITIALGSAGARVFAVGRFMHKLEPLCQALADAGLRVSPLVADVTAQKDVTAMVGEVESTAQALDIVVNCASPSVEGPTGLDATPEAFASSTEGHVTSLWRLVQCSRPLLEIAARNRGDASIINIASMYGKVSPVPSVYSRTGVAPNPPFYGSAKAGGLQLARWLAANLGPSGIRVNSVSPGPFPQAAPHSQSSGFVLELAQRTMLGRVGDRQEVAGAVVFLASQASRFITGADIPVDGGWTAW